MNYLNRLFYIFLGVLAIQGCSKESIPTIDKGLEPEPIPKHYISTGESDHESINYTVFEPALLVKGNKLLNENGYSHRDSLLLDVNHDGILDLKFEYSDYYNEIDCPEDTIANDSIIFDCFPDAWNECYISCLSDIELLSFDNYQERPVPLSNGIELRIYQSTNANEFMDTEYFWKKGINSLILAWVGMGNSWDSQKSHYLGFRFPASDSTATHGWINLGCKGTTCIEIYEMGIEK